MKTIVKISWPHIGDSMFTAFEWDIHLFSTYEKILKKYTSQLHAYKFALENPMEGEPIKISKMGAVSINPDEMKLVNGKVVFTTTPTWHPIEENMDNFYKLIQDISTVLNGSLPPTTATCNLCIYRKSYEPKSKVVDDIPF